MSRKTVAPTLLPCRLCRRHMVEPGTFPQRCVDCIAKVAKQEAQFIKERAEYDRRVKAGLIRTQNRTDAEFTQVMYDILKEGKVERCQGCMLKFPILDKEDPRLYYDDVELPNAILYVSYGVWPFQEEINEDDSKHWICNVCCYEDAQEI